MMKQRTKIAMLALLIIIAAGVFYLDTKGTSLGGKETVFTSKSYPPLAVENPELQRWKRETSRRTEYKSSGRDLFSETLPPPPVQKVERPPDPVPQAPVEAPPPSLPA